MIKNLVNKLKNSSLSLWGLFVWLLPLAIFLISTYIPKILWNPSFNDYIEFLKILIWPYTVLVILFFFKRVVTYLFFSMDEFNFFGAKGNLKNINDVITEEINKKYLEKENEEKRINDMEKLNKEIKIKELEISQAKGANSELVKGIMQLYKKSKEQTISLDAENKRLKEIISGLSPIVPDVASVSNFDDSKTSDPIPEESSIKQ